MQTRATPLSPRTETKSGTLHVPMNAAMVDRIISPIFTMSAIEMHPIPRRLVFSAISKKRTKSNGSPFISKTSADESAKSLPRSPMATPMSARAKLGASLMPSPKNATVPSFFWVSVARWFLFLRGSVRQSLLPAAIPRERAERSPVCRPTKEGYESRVREGGKALFPHAVSRRPRTPRIRNRPRRSIDRQSPQSSRWERRFLSAMAVW